MDDSPLAGKGQPSRHSVIKLKGPEDSGDIGLFDDATEDEACSTADEESEGLQSQDENINSESEANSESEPAADDGEDSEWTPETTDDGSPESSKTHPASKWREAPRTSPVKLEPPSSPSLQDSSPEPATVKKPKARGIVAMDPPASPLQHKSKTKSLKGGDIRVKEERASVDELFGEGWTDNAEDSTIIIPNKQARKAALAHAGEDAEYVPRPGEVDDAPKKKKRTLGKKTVVTEDEIEAVISKVAKVGLEGKKQGSVRRLATRGSK